MSNEQKTDKNVDKPLVLCPRTSSMVDGFLADDVLVRRILLACGSPVNVLFPQSVAANVKSFEDVLAAHNLKGSLYFAHKSNQSHSLLRQMAVTALRADVASIEELRHALSCGFTGSRLEATGPKNAEFLYLCLLHSVVVNVDSLQELDDIIALKKSLALTGKVRILLRLCGFGASCAQVLAKESRFGIRRSDAPRALAKVVEQSADVELLGFAFHLDSTSLDERLVAVENCVAIFDDAVNLGLEPCVLNIGGGFRINYLAEEEDWNQYMTAMKQAVLGTGPQITWQNNFFGLSAHTGTLHGKLNSYGYYEPNPGAGFLSDLLNSELPSYGNQKLASVLRDNMIELWLEPGRSLLDQSGVTLARVNSVKISSAGDMLVALNMKRQDIAFLDQEVFVDPILVACKSTEWKPKPVYFTGDLCLESDLIFRHKVYLPSVPQHGDIMAFVNTAAYMMDFSATNSIMQPPARRVAAVQDNNSFTWMLDEQYTPVWQFYDRRSTCS